MSDRCELLVVGDVHGAWDEIDHDFAAGAGADLVVFVGDLANEDLAMVSRVATLPAPKVVLLGNHDAWAAVRNRRLERVRESIRVLGDDHLAFRSRRVGSAGSWAVVGARSFSWGGTIDRQGWFFDAMFGVSDPDRSARRIHTAAEEVPGASLVLVGHNGPYGLGEGAGAIYGRDFARPHVDFGDPDFGEALRTLRSAGRRVVLTLAGHMHDQLRGGGERQRRVDRDGTVHVNAAVVPRHRTGPSGRARHFLRVVLEASAVVSVEDLWVGDAGTVIARGDITTLTRGAAADPPR